MKRMVMMVVLVSMIGCIKPQEKQEARVREALPPKTTAESMLESADDLDQIIDKLIKEGADPNGEAITRLRESAARLRRKAETGRSAYS